MHVRLIAGAAQAIDLALMRRWPQTLTTFRHARGCLLLYPRTPMQALYRCQQGATAHLTRHACIR